MSLFRYRNKLHKYRNVLGHLPERLHASVERALGTAWDLQSEASAKRALERLARSLEDEHPGAAASIREGLRETLTVLRLGLTGSLQRTLRTTNIIENLNSGVPKSDLSVPTQKGLATGWPIKHPYVNTIGGLSKAIEQFRDAFPPTVNASTLQKLGIAPNNETYVLSAFRFLGFIDENEKRTSAAATIFSHHDDQAFAQAFGKSVQDAYAGLFELHGEKSWSLDNDSLIAYFRGTDQTSAIVGKRQANTFRALARFAGYGDSRDAEAKGRPTKTVEKKKTTSRRTVDTPPSAKKDASNEHHKALSKDSSRVGLTVRVEINLPAEGDQDTYDRIFKSIRENLLND